MATVEALDHLREFDEAERELEHGAGPGERVVDPLLALRQEMGEALASGDPERPPGPEVDDGHGTELIAHAKNVVER